MSACLSFEELEQHATGSGSASGSSASDHLQSCPTCRERFEQVRNHLAMFDACRAFGAEFAREALTTPLSEPGDSQATPTEVLDAPAAGPDAPQIDGYQILEEVHRGAQGVVYKAIQESANRTVALKLMLHGPYASRRQERRFEREIELVATLEHPNIVRLYDSRQGDGQHCFAMEYVEGLPLTDYVVANHLPVRETLGLFAKTCRAVAHAHQRGVIHRDLKPGNILADADGEPHVLDFGLAKPTADALAGPDSLATQTGEFFGTLAYASPEQASGQPDRVDTRTDVYALGVILYETLTGCRPYPTDGAISQVLKNIAEAEPKRPSQHNPQLDDELDTIILKALAKDSDRRYPSADALATDIGRYLAGRPIEAKADSGWYVLKKNLARYRAAVLAAAVVFLSVIAFAITVVAQSARLARERDRAILAERTTGEARNAERAQRALAEQRELMARRHAYAAHMNLAMEATKRWNHVQVKGLLEKHRPLAGQEDLRGFEWYYLWRQMHSDELTIEAHSRGARCVAFSPDGKHLVSGGGGGEKERLRLWDAATGRAVGALVGHTDAVTSVAFSPDGKRLASASEDLTVRLWDVTTGECRTTFRGHTEPVASLAFSPDGKALATGEGDLSLHYRETIPQRPGMVRVWEVATQRQWDSHKTGAISSLAFSPDGELLAVGSWDKTVKLWDVVGRDPQSSEKGTRAWALRHRSTLRHDVLVGCLAFSPDGKTLLVSGWDNTLNLWDPSTGQKRASLKMHAAWSFAFSPDGRTLAVGTHFSSICLWDAVRRHERDTLLGHTGVVKGVAFSPDGQRLASTCTDGTVKLWDPSKRYRPVRLGRHEQEIGSLAFSTNGKTLVTGSRDGTATFWDPATGQCRATLGAPGNFLRGEWVNAVAFSPNGKTLAMARADTMSLWDVATGQKQATLGKHGTKVYAVAFSPDGRSLISASRDKTVKVWDPRTRREKLTLSGHSARINAAAFSPDGKLLATGSSDRTVRLWDTRTWAEHATLKGHTNWVLSLAFSPDGKTLATGGWLREQSQDQPVELKLWDVATTEERINLRGHKWVVCSLAFSPDGETLASGGDAGNTRLWDVVTGQARCTFQALGVDWVLGLAFSPDGKTLVTSSRFAEGRYGVLVWQRATEQEVLAKKKGTFYFSRPR